MANVADDSGDLETEKGSVGVALPVTGLVASPKNGCTNPTVTEQARACTDSLAAASEGLVKISFFRLNCMLCFNLANGVLLSSYMLLVLPLESQRIDSENRSVILAGLMFIAGSTQLINPIVGLLSDRCTCSWGRRRPFLIIGGLVGAFGILTQAYSSIFKHPLLYFVAYAVSMVALNSAYTAVVGIMPDFVPHEQSGTASGIAALHTLVGANFGFLVFYNTSGTTDDRLLSIYMTFVVIIVVCILITSCACREIPLTPSRVVDVDADVVDDEQKQLTRAGVKGKVPSRCLSSRLRAKDLLDCYYIDPSTNWDFFLVFWSRTFYYLGASVQAFLKYYLKDVVGIEDPEDAIIKFAIVAQLSAAATAIPVGLLSDRVSSRKPFIYVACAFLATGQALTCFVRDMTEVMSVCILLGAANGIYLAMDAALALDTLPSGGDGARFMGVWGVGCFLGSAFGPVLCGPVLAFGGHQEGSKDAYTFAGYAIVFGIAAFNFFTSGAILRHVGGDANPSPSCTNCVCLRRKLRRVKNLGVPTQEGLRRVKNLGVPTQEAARSVAFFKRCVAFPHAVFGCCAKRSAMNA
eukprot:TRINITY_DN6115_c0_g1_i1.p1 TRINITY_DN6115_c0_g1~~TRINITY_DN6115_c0_g1_i1.p1  ORF type:complete len:579 (-),score=78.38 TRINITY_DN6115_c0_g1_i1:75-1811(-)